MTKIIGLFPTPLMKVDGCVGGDLLRQFAERAESAWRAANSASDLLSHTEMMESGADASCAELARLIEPHLASFGALLLGTARAWIIKEMWLNVLEPGGSQFMHTHANAFVSGVVYVTEPDASSRTVFRKPSGGGEFIFKNDVPVGHYSSDTWVMPETVPGDLVLYPSYLLHGVPPNEGARRITLAFNAIPDALDSLGYRIRFAP